MQQSDYYSLLVAPESGIWDNGRALMPAERYIEHTVGAVQAKFFPLDEAVEARLLRCPAVFAYERSLGQPARVGNITAIHHRSNGFYLQVAFDSAVPAISPALLEGLADELDIDLRANELGRTHWAVKQVDLFDVLRRQGLVFNPFAASPPNTRPRGPVSVGQLAGAVMPTMSFIGGKTSLDAEKTVEKLLSTPQPPAPALNVSRRVFIVHGHNVGIREEVARFVAKVGLEPVILHEQPNQGRTILAKFQEEAASARFAIVLLTPDDRGGAAAADMSDYRSRARQNVVFEFGFFAGHLGMGHVCALVDSQIEKPSDIDGLVYVSLNGDWKLHLAREMSAAGLPVDAAALISG